MAPSKYSRPSCLPLYPPPVRRGSVCIVHRSQFPHTTVMAGLWKRGYGVYAKRRTINYYHRQRDACRSSLCRLDYSHRFTKHRHADRRQSKTCRVEMERRPSSSWRACVVHEVLYENIYRRSESGNALKKVYTVQEEYVESRGCRAFRILMIPEAIWLIEQ